MNHPKYSQMVIRDNEFKNRATIAARNISRKPWNRLDSRTAAYRKVMKAKVRWAEKLVQIKIFNGQPNEQRLMQIRRKAYMTTTIPGKSILKVTKNSQYKFGQLFDAKHVDESSISTNFGKSSPDKIKTCRPDAKMSREKEIADEMYFSWASNLKPYYSQGSSAKSQVARNISGSKYMNDYDFVIKWPQY